MASARLVSAKSARLASAEVEIEDGYIVAAVDPTGSEWNPAGAEWNTDGHRSRGHLRRLTHLMVLGAAAIPMTVTLAWAHPTDPGRVRLEIETPKSALAQAASLGRGGLVLAAANVDSAPPPTTPAVVQAEPLPPVPGGLGLHFPWGYCTWYVSTRRQIPWSGDAWSWYGAAIAMGYSVGSTPRPGAIMVSKEGPVGHVAYVESVDGQYFTVSEMNFHGFGIVDHRTIRLGSISLYGFIY